jgi:hypothetical protein
MHHRPALALLLAGPCIFICIAAHASCDTGLAERMHAKLHPARQLDHELAVCQPWRGFMGRFIVVLPIPIPRSPSSSADSAATEYDLDVLVVQQADNGNTEHAKVVSRLFETAALREDGGTHISDIRLDTARYALAADARAFGLRVSRQGSPQDAPYSNETLSLYVPHGPKLAKVLDGLETTLERGETNPVDCAGSFNAVHGNLALARSASHGYADLVLRQTRSQSRTSLQGDSCTTREQPARLQTTTLHFDGTEYRQPKAVAPG